MATVTSVVTVDTTIAHSDSAEWVYVDSYGINHTVSDAETFSITIENTANNIKWNVIAEAPSLATTELATDDGYKIKFRPQADGSNRGRELRVMALADATMSRVVGGEWSIECPVSGRVQHWKFAQFYTSNVDMNAAGTIGANTVATSCILEDQFGNTMSLPYGLVAGITVAQAA